MFFSYTINPQKINSFKIRNTFCFSKAIECPDRVVISNINGDAQNFTLSNSVGEGKSLYSNYFIFGDIIIFDFETGMSPNIKLIDGDCGWEVGSRGTSNYFNIPKHTSYAYANDDACGNGGDMGNVWMILPEFDFSDIANPFVQFEYFGRSGSFSIKASKNEENRNTLKTIYPFLEISKNEYIKLNNNYANAFFIKIASHFDDMDAWGHGWAVDDFMFLGDSSFSAITFSVTDETAPLEGTKIGIENINTIFITNENGQVSTSLENETYNFHINYEECYEYSGLFIIADNNENVTVMLNCLESINQKGKKNAFINPNPTQRILRIEAPEDNNIEIIDITGRFVYFSNMSDFKHVDIYFKQASLYIIRLIKKCIKF